ncbi:MAG: excinuclease ABC subunit UvrC, partial [Liquorilactobacillus satsumensis]
GNVGHIKRTLEAKMSDASPKLEFERAAEVRDQIHYIEVTVERQKIISNDNTPRDLFNFYMDKGWLSLQIFFIRQARLIKREKRLFPCIDKPEAELESFILQFYNQKNRILPKEILVPTGVSQDVLAEILKIPVKTPQRGAKRDLMQLAQQNAKLILDEKFRLLELDDRKTTGAMDELTQALHLPQGHRIEAFDHSHLQGTDPVSAMICFIDGRPEKDQYRKYKLKTVTHADEAASTREVIRRRYSRLLKEHAQLPDLILMDGGIVQVEAVIDVLQNELNLSIPVAGMVKDEHHKTAALMNAAFQKVPLDPKSEGFYLLQRIQDEVHRFAITFHRKAHSKNSLSSRLDLIPGVGPKSRTKLLRKFGSMKKITEAPVNEIQALGISKKVAQMIKLSLK